MAQVPEGSILEPILYVLFTADIQTSAIVLTTTFADDTTILCRRKCPIKATNTVKKHLKPVGSWHV